MKLAQVGLATFAMACGPGPLETVPRLPDAPGARSPLASPPARAAGPTALGVLVLRRELDLSAARDTVDRFLRAAARGDPSGDDTVFPGAVHRTEGGSVTRLEEAWLRPSPALGAVLSGDGRRRMECRAATEAVDAPPASAGITQADAWVRTGDLGADVWFLLRGGPSGYKIVETVEAASKQ